MYVSKGIYQQVAYTYHWGTYKLGRSVLQLSPATDEKTNPWKSLVNGRAWSPAWEVWFHSSTLNSYLVLEVCQTVHVLYAKESKLESTAVQEARVSVCSHP